MCKVKKACNKGEGPDVIIEMLANVNLSNDLKILNHNGTIAIVGNRGEISISPRDLMMCEGQIVGVMGGSLEEF